jgi:hypothetical protein
VTTRAPLPGGDRETSIVVSEGLREGVILAVVAVGLGVAGLSPSFTWIPEVLLLALLVLVPAAILGVAGYRAGSRAGGVVPGALAGALAGAIGGFVGGLTYVAFGKPVLNVVVGMVGGALGGTIVGAIGAVLSARRDDPENPRPSPRGGEGS